MTLINRYDHDALAGETCRQCGKIHEPTISRTLILGIIGLALIGLAYWLWRKQQWAQFWKEWEVNVTNSEPFMQAYINDGWRVKNGAFYAPGDGPR